MNQPADLRKQMKEGVIGRNHIPKEEKTTCFHCNIYNLIEVVYHMGNIIKTFNPRARRGIYYQLF